MISCVLTTPLGPGPTLTIAGHHRRPPLRFDQCQKWRLQRHPSRGAPHRHPNRNSPAIPSTYPLTPALRHSNSSPRPLRNAPPSPPTSSKRSSSAMSSSPAPTTSRAARPSHPAFPQRPPSPSPADGAPLASSRPRASPTRSCAAASTLASQLVPRA
jgi:hypothetical protein